MLFSRFIFSIKRYGATWPPDSSSESLCRNKMNVTKKLHHTLVTRQVSAVLERQKHMLPMGSSCFIDCPNKTEVIFLTIIPYFSRKSRNQNTYFVENAATCTQLQIKLHLDSRSLHENLAPMATRAWDFPSLISCSSSESSSSSTRITKAFCLALPSLALN